MNHQIARPEDLPQIVAILTQAYHVEPRATAEELRQFGLDGYRLFRQGDRIAAVLECISLGQWFGGRSVSCAAIAMVATPLESRGSGAAMALLQSVLADLHQQGRAISLLYPSTLSLYRKVGFERAGSLVRYDLPLAGLKPGPRDGELVQVELTSPELKRVYAACAARTNGLLDRDESFWLNRFDPLKGVPLTPYAVRFQGQTEGYVILAQSSLDRRLLLREAMFSTARAGQRILALLADHGTMFDTARWWGAPADPLVHLLPDRLAVGTLQHDWMLRVVDLPKALEARGYGLSAEAILQLEVEDRLLPANNGRWRVRIESGRAQIEPGGQGRVWLDIRGLAALYSGHLGPALLELLGLVRGSADDLARLGAVFAGPGPYLSDAF